MVDAVGVDVCWTDDWLDVDKHKLELLSDKESGFRLRFSASAMYAYRHGNISHDHKPQTENKTKNLYFFSAYIMINYCLASNGTNLFKTMMYGG